MRKTGKLLAVVVFASAMVTQREARAEDRYHWKLVDTENDCQIFTSEVAGKDYIAAKTTCMVPARTDLIGVVLRDIPNYPEWMADCKATKVLKVLDDDKDVFIFWLHQHVTLFKDRDMVLKTHVDVDYRTGHTVIDAVSTNEVAYDSGKNLYRMPSFRAQWTLEWIDSGHSLVTYVIDPDLGSGIPSSLANSTIKKLPYKSIEGLKKMVKEKTYIEAAKTSKYTKGVEEALAAGTLKR